MPATDGPVTVPLTLWQNPFYQLGLDPRDRPARILEAVGAGEFGDLDVPIGDMAAWLMDPHHRLVAEMGWMPGVAGDMAIASVRQLQSDPTNDRAGVGLSGLAAANWDGSKWLSATIVPDQDAWVAGVLGVVEQFARLDLQAVQAVINDDRRAAGFPPVDDGEVAEGMRDRQVAIGRAFAAILDGMPSGLVLAVVGALAHGATRGGSESPGPLIQSLLDAYETGITPALVAEATNIDRLISLSFEPAVERDLDPILDRLDRVIGNWCRMAKPIQEQAVAGRQTHAPSVAIVGEVRGRVGRTFLERGWIEAARRVTTILLAGFGLMPDLYGLLNDDQSRFDEMERRRDIDARVAPIRALCRSVAERVDAKPGRAGAEAKRFLLEAPPMVARINRLSPGETGELADMVALTLATCGLALGNHRADWVGALPILERAKGIAWDPAVIAELEGAIATAKDRVGSSRRRWFARW